MVLYSFFAFLLVAFLLAIALLFLLPTAIRVLGDAAQGNWPGPRVALPDKHERHSLERLGAPEDRLRPHVYPAFFKAYLGVIIAFGLSVFSVLNFFFWWVTPIAGLEWVAFGLQFSACALGGWLMFRDARAYSRLIRHEKRPKEVQELRLQTRHCSICNEEMQVAAVVVVALNLSQHPHNHLGCYRCEDCGRLTCFPCSSLSRACKCGARKWVETHYFATEKNRMVTYQQYFSKDVASPLDEAARFMERGAIFVDSGDFDNAILFKKQEEEIYRNYGHDRLRALALGDLGRLLQETGRSEEALGTYEVQEQVLRRIPDAEWLPTCLLAQAEILMMTPGRQQEEKAVLEEALGLAKKYRFGPLGERIRSMLPNGRAPT